MSKSIQHIDLITSVDELRIQANTELDESTRGQKGQFMTPAPVAKLLANKFSNLSGELCILDAGAGVGSLTTALIERALNDFSPTSININAWEIENVLAENLETALNLCSTEASIQQISYTSKIHRADFIQSAIDILNARKEGKPTPSFNKAILNPPYLKIAASSKERALLRSVGIETANLYSCFVSLALLLLEDGGELVAITPRSFCNGPYFKDFRRILLDGNSLDNIHIFESRTKAFKGDKVLQETVIYHVVKNKKQGNVEICSSSCSNDPQPTMRVAQYNEVVNPHNPDKFIHIVINNEQAQIATKIGGMPCSLSDLGIEASTGKVVDFRTKENLSHNPTVETVPLIYPMHFNNGQISWPIESKKKPNALLNNDKTKKQLVPNGTYVLTKRLTAKEEVRRIVAALYTPDIADVQEVGFENKTNYFHALGKPLDPDVARGLWAYLNSSLVEQYFRQFNGHTQVNATDLRTLRYPDINSLKAIGKKVINFNQQTFDDLVESL